MNAERIVRNLGRQLSTAALALSLTGLFAGGVFAQTLTLAVSLDNGSFDPAMIENGPRAQYWVPVYDTLLLMEPDTSISGNLAESFEYDETNTILTLHLRDDVTFTDGTPFNAGAVKANIEHLGAGTGQNSFMVDSVAEVEIVDQYTVRLHLDAPNPAQLVYFTMAGGAVGSPAALDGDEIVSNPVGSGAYMLDTSQTTLGAQYVYKHNPDYWNLDAVKFDEVKIIPMGEMTARLNALRSGQVDGAQGDANTAAEATAAGLTVSTTPIDRRGLTLADRNGKINPAFADLRVRQAINHAIDGAGLLHALQHDLGTSSKQVFSASSNVYMPELDDMYPYDPEKARELLAEAGYADGFDLIMPENPNEPSNPIIESQLAEVGINVKWDKVLNENYVSAATSPKYAAFWMSLSATNPWWDLSKQVTASGPWNPQDSATLELTDLINRAQAASGDEYVDLMKQINTYITENAWFDIWYQADAIYFTNPDTVKVAMHPNNLVPYIHHFSPAD